MKKLILSLSLIGASSLALADSYVSIGLSKSTTSGSIGELLENEQNDFIEELQNVPGVNGSSSVNGENGFSISYGQSVTDIFGWQLSYIDAGGLSLAIDISVEDESITADMEIALKTVEFVGTAKTAITENLNLYGLFGIHMWDADVIVKASTTDERFSESDDGTDLTYGAGVSYKLNEDFSINLQWQKFDLDGEDLQNLSAKLSYYL